MDKLTGIDTLFFVGAIGSANSDAPAYQILTRSAGAMYMASPGLTPKAS